MTGSVRANACSARSRSHPSSVSTGTPTSRAPDATQRVGRVRVRRRLDEHAVAAAEEHRRDEMDRALRARRHEHLVGEVGIPRRVYRSAIASRSSARPSTS